jgi:hypothetical protein
MAKMERNVAQGEGSRESCARHQVTTRSQVVGYVGDEAPALGIAVELAAFECAEENTREFPQEIARDESRRACDCEARSGRRRVEGGRGEGAGGWVKEGKRGTGEWRRELWPCRRENGTR